MIEGARLNDPLKGIICMLIGGALLTANDALLKWLTSDYPIGQIIFLRGVFVLIPILIVVWRAGGINTLVTQNFSQHMFRSSLMIVGTFLFLTGLKFLPLADAISIAFAGPLFVTALAPSLLGERVGWRRWVGVFIGFLGIVIIFQPGGSMFQWAALFPLAASLTGALRDILTRKMSASETSEALLFYSTIAVALSGLTTVPFSEWQMVIVIDLVLFALTGILIGGAHFLMIEAFRYCEAAMVVPFKYASVLWAILFGYFIFREMPDAHTFLGAAVVVSCGVYILHRERVLRKNK